ncbi:MAG: hypothetical protein ABIE36_01705 [Candidatus Diapherotrites archaeon]
MKKNLNLIAKDKKVLKELEIPPEIIDKFEREVAHQIKNNKPQEKERKEVWV